MDDRTKVIEGAFAKRAVSEESDEYQAFTFGRIGAKPQLTLLVRKATGEVEGFPYADFAGISAKDEDAGFSVRFGPHSVRIEGRNLKQLFQYVCNYRAAEIIQADERTVMTIGPDKGVVWGISIKP